MERRAAAGGWKALGMVATLLLLGTAVGACEGRETTTSALAQARAAHEAGNLDEAATQYQAALQEDPENTQALIGMAEVEVQRGNLEQANQGLSRLDNLLGLPPRDLERIRQARRAYYAAAYERSRGEGPAAPADPAVYEESLIGLFNRDANPAYGEELIQLFTYQARQALGATDPSQPIAPGSPALQNATLEQLRAAQTQYQELLQRDTRLGRSLEIPEATRAEAQAVLPELERQMYERELQQHFDTTMRSALVAANQFDEASNRFRFSLVEFQLPVEPPPEGTPEREAFNNALIREVVVENLTQLAAQARGIADPNVPPLIVGRTPEAQAEAYSEVEVVRLEIAPRTNVANVEVLVPWTLFSRTARVADQYIAWRAEHPVEGTGAGTGMGTGAAVPPGTGAGTGAP